MADNRISYNRFTALPPNISSFGSTVEELNLSRGTPDPNPMVGPMATPKATEAKLALLRQGSDQFRLGAPTEPTENPYEGPRSTFQLSRRAVEKLRGKVLNELATLVQAERIGDPNVRKLMGGSLRCVEGLRDYVGELNKMTEAVYVRSIAASKG